MLTNSDYKFIQNEITGKWIISAPRRAQRPDSSKGTAVVCPFCPENLKKEKELYKIGDVIVVPNKFPFAPIHEIVIHSKDHEKNFGDLSDSNVSQILKAYRQRFQTHEKSGQVYIFHNRGERGGESLTHPHSQITVIPENITLEIPPIAKIGDRIETENFFIFCPQSSNWPDEIWISPNKVKSKNFGEITDEEVYDFAKSLNRIIRIMDHRHGNEFPYNFYVYPKKDWYLRLIPRLKTLGGFELGTNVFVNTQDPNETMAFLKEHFEKPDFEKIKAVHLATYKRGV